MVISIACRHWLQTARGLAIGVRVLKASSERGIDAGFASFIQQGVNAVLLGAMDFFFSRRDELVGLAARHAIPVIYYLREYAMALKMRKPNGYSIGPY
jgi:putative tryptophan/tyrosine transport system substrate-binding protein